MSLLKDVVVTLGDVMRLSSDVMRHTVETQARAVREGIGRVVASLILAMTVTLIALAGAGFVVYAIFVYIARAVGSPVAALIVGFGLLLAAVVVFLVGRSATIRS